MKKVLLLICLIAVSMRISAQLKVNQAYLSYINQYKDIAIEEMERYNIPASITLAQGLFESGAGRSELATKGNNHFGIKCHGWTGATITHDDDAKNECFRAYNNAMESYEDHSKFLVSSQRYSRLFQLNKTDYKGWAQGLKDCGYATNPAYAQKIINIIETYNLNQYDTPRYVEKVVNTYTPTTKTVTRETGLHSIKMFNDNYYLIAREGDTFKSIGKEVNISWRSLAEYNERDKRDKLHKGDIIFLKKKRSKAPKSFKNRPHTVKNGESMYSICQMYGMRLKKLYKLNHLSPDYNIKAGDRLRVR